MEIIDIRVLRGPNYWSNYWTNLIVLKVDLKKYELLPSNLIPGFIENLTQLLPSLEEHYCSLGVRGGFIQRLKEGTWLGHIAEHIAIELQCLAGMDSRYGRTRATSAVGIYDIVFSYEIEEAGIYAAKTAVKIVNSLANSILYPSIQPDIEKLKKIKKLLGLGISAQAILNEAKVRKIPYSFLENSLILLGHGRYQKIISSALSSETSFLGVDIASDKVQTKNILTDGFIPAPNGKLVRDLKGMMRAVTELGYPLVIKPLDANHGRGVTTNITCQEKAIAAYKIARKISSHIIVERFIVGHDYRFLVVNYKLIAVAQRLPAMIVGDGNSTIQLLIDKINQDSNRGNGHENFLSTIEVDASTLLILKENNLTTESILPKDQKLSLKCTSNLSSGGTAKDVTGNVHPYNIFLAERIARLMNLNICGIDVIAERIDLPLTEKTGAVLEVNAEPGLRMHLQNTDSQNNNVAKNIVDMLFPLNNGRIPLVAVTGTNGKTTTVRLIAYLAGRAGYKVGFTTTDGIYIDGHQIYAGDCSGPKSASTILRDPLVEFAVLECARGGILRSGLGFDHCHISVITNISEDHLGLEGIEKIQQLITLKSVVAHSTVKDGYAILNADDSYVYSLKDKLHANIALFSMHSNNAHVKMHCDKNGLAAYMDDYNRLIVHIENKDIIVGNIVDFPITYGGYARVMIQNLLPAILAGVISGFKIENIIDWLKNLYLTPEKFPGRMNLFDLNGLKILVDYAHNCGAFLGLKDFIQKIICKKRIGIVGSPGDRRPIDIIKLGHSIAEIMDEVIIRHDKDGRGKTNEEITALLIKGMQNRNPEVKISVISDEQAALEHTIERCNPNDFILHLPENPTRAISYLTNLNKKEL